MTREDFIKLVNAYGSYSRNWPDSVRGDAEAFVSENPEAAEAVLSEERALDAWLEQANTPVDTELLQRRISKSVSQTPQGTRTGKQMNWGAMAAMLAVSFTLGVFGGRNWPETMPVTTDVTMEELTQYADTADTLGLSEIYEWASADDL